MNGYGKVQKHFLHFLVYFLAIPCIKGLLESFRLAFMIDGYCEDFFVCLI